MYIYDNIAEFFLEEEMFQTKVVVEMKTHILYPVVFFESRVVYEMV